MAILRIIGTIALMITFAFAKAQAGAEALNLENFNLSFNVERFYAPFLEKEKLYKEQRQEILNGKVEKDFGAKLVDPWSVETISIDAVFVNGNLESSNQLVGTQYNMKSWTEGRNMAYYGNTHFDAVHMMRSKAGNFMALVATVENESEEAFRNLISQLEKKYGEAKITEDDFFGGYSIYSWQLADRLIAISTKYNDKSNEIKVAVDPVSRTVDTTKHPSIDTKFFLVNNKYRKAISGKLKSGAWLYFDKLLEN